MTAAPVGYEIYGRDLLKGERQFFKRYCWYAREKGKADRFLDLLPFPMEEKIQGNLSLFLSWHCHYVPATDLIDWTEA